MLKLILGILFLSSGILYAEDFVPDSFQAEYSKNYKNEAGKDVQEQGTFTYLYPKHARFESISKSTIFVFNPETSWFYKKSTNDVKVAKAIPLPLMKVLDALKTGLEGSPFDKKSSGFNLILVSKPDFVEETDIKEVELQNSFKHAIKTLKDVKHLVFIDTENKRTVFEFSHFKTLKSDTKSFNFKIPSGAKVHKED
jgi:outer membrane lipoprotein-sorting protein